MKKDLTKKIEIIGKALGIPEVAISQALTSPKKRGGRKGNPLPVSQLFNKKAGDKVFIYWAKDNDPDDVRLNGIYKILWNENGTMECPECYEWDKDEIIDGTQNCLDTSRGLAYFYEVIK